MDVKRATVDISTLTIVIKYDVMEGIVGLVEEYRITYSSIRILKAES